MAKCRETDGDYLAWSCANCPRTRAEDLDPYTVKLLRVRVLQAAGYPLAADDLTMEEWLDLGVVNQWLQATSPTST